MTISNKVCVLYSGGWILVMEIVPGFSLYRGLYELGQYAFYGSTMGATGMTWRNLKDPNNGMCDILIIMTVEWALLLVLAFYLDRVSSIVGGVRNPLLLFRCSQKKHTPSLQKTRSAQQDSKVIVSMEKADVAQEVGYLPYFVTSSFFYRKSVLKLMC